MITKEQMLEAIREAVVLANNPECKTLEEALEKESKNNYCLIKLDNGFITDCVNRSKNIKNSDYKILGLPITLERIMIAIEKNHDDILYSNGEICKYRTNFKLGYEFLDVEVLCDWKLNQTLENQSEETIKTIYKILIKQ